MRHRRARAVTLLAALTVSAIAIAAPVSATEHAPVSPPPMPHVESLITEGVNVEGPLINSVALPHLL